MATYIKESVILLIIIYAVATIATVSLVWAFYCYCQKYHSHTTSFFLATLKQCNAHAGVLTAVAVFIILITVCSTCIHVFSREHVLEMGIFLAVVGTIATCMSLFNTYYIIHITETRVYSYDKFLDRLTNDLGQTIKCMEKHETDCQDAFVYILAYTPLLGSISANPHKYGLFQKTLRTVVGQVDSVFIRANNAHKFHEEYGKGLARFAGDVEKKSGQLCVKEGSKLARFIEERDIHLDALISVNRASATQGRLAEDITEATFDKMPPFYVFATQTLTAICLIRYEEREGNEIIAIISEEKFYKDFAYELLARNCGSRNAADLFKKIST